MSRIPCWFGAHEMRGLSLPGGDRVVFVCDRCGRYQRAIPGRDDVVMEPTNIYHHSPTAAWERKSSTGSGFPKYVVTVNGAKIVIQGRSGKADIPKDVVPWLLEALTAATEWKADDGTDGNIVP